MSTSVFSSQLLVGEPPLDVPYQRILDHLPTAVYATDETVRLTYFNKAAARFSGRSPELGTDRWCVSWKLYNTDGSPMPHEECPMALTLKEQREIVGAEAIAERPDGQRIRFMPFPALLRDDDGKVIEGGSNLRLTSVPHASPGTGLTIGVATGHAKVIPIKAALNGGIINGLLTYENTAKAILAA